MSGTHRWRWTEEQPGVIVIVMLVLAFSLLFPHNACRGRTVVERSAVTTPAGTAGFDEPSPDGE